jgi:4-hydroxybenzoate polyprenyltransferase
LTSDRGVRSRDATERAFRPAAGIYGLIVTGSVLATAGTQLRTAPLTVAVFVTLLVYWLAEQYAEVVEHASAGHLPSWAHTRAGLRKKWPLVSASYIPLVALLLARAVGASPWAAALVALVVIMALLMWYGWKAGRSSGLQGFAQFIMTVLAGGLGLVMILLKVLLVHLH